MQKDSLIVEIGNGNDSSSNISNFVLNFKLNQYTNQHHQLEIEVRTDALDKGNSFMSTSLFQLIGKEIKLAWIDDVIGKFTKGTGEVFFFGLITGINTERSGASKGILRINAMSPTILLDDGKHCRSFEKSTLSNITKQVLSNCDRNYFPNIQVQPSNDLSRDYTVQYNESSYDFINNLARRHGEWFYYDGTSLIFGQKEKEDAEDVMLSYDQDLSSFSVNTKTESPKFAYLTRDFINDTTQLITTDEVSSEKMGEVGEMVYENLNKLFPNTTNVHSAIHLSENQEKNLMKRVAELEKASIVANLVSFSGKSDNRALRPGSIFSINDFIGQSMLDKYFVTEIEHRYDKVLGYSNTFKAIEAKVEVSIHTDVQYFPTSEPQTATVVNNNDPLGIGRIQVQMEWQTDEDAHPWVRMSQGHSGSGKGFYFIPEIGEEVIAGFEGGNAETPYVSGAYHHSSHKTPVADPNIKMLQTRSGNKIRLNDSDGSVSIIDSSGSTVNMDGAGNISITCSENLSINAGKNIDIEAGEQLSVKTGTSSTFNIGTDNTFNVGDDFKVDAGKSIKMDAGKNAIINAAMNFIGASKGMGAITITPVSSILHHVVLTNVASMGMLTTASTGQTIIKGSKVNIN